MGWTNWSRRLALAVLYDVNQIAIGTRKLQSELPESQLNRIIGEACLLEGLARAYLRDIYRAHACLIDAERNGTLTIEAVAQLLVSSEGNAPDVAYWAALRLPKDIDLGGRAEGRRLRVWRRGLVTVLRAREKTHYGVE
jgi:hypothetical protein